MTKWRDRACLRALVLCLFGALALSQPALACRGPFSAPYQLNLQPEDQVYLGRVVSIHDVALDPAHPDRLTKLTTFRVERAWQKTPPRVVAITNVSMNVADSERCVRVINPAPGEKWIVVAYRLGDRLQAKSYQAYQLKSGPVLEQTLGFLRKHRGDGYVPRSGAPEPAPAAPR